MDKTTIIILVCCVVVALKLGATIDFVAKVLAVLIRDSVRNRRTKKQKAKALLDLKNEPKAPSITTSDGQSFSGGGALSSYERDTAVMQFVMPRSTAAPQISATTSVTPSTYTGTNVTIPNFSYTTTIPSALDSYTMPFTTYNSWANPISMAPFNLTEPTVTVKAPEKEKPKEEPKEEVIYERPKRQFDLQDDGL